MFAMNAGRYFLAAGIVLAVVLSTSCSQSNANDDAELNAAPQRVVDGVNGKNIDGIMSYYVPDETLLVYDAVIPRQYVGAAAFKKDWQEVLSVYPTTVHAELSDWKVDHEGNLAVGHGIFKVVGPDEDGKPLELTVRLTDEFKKVNGKWLVVHEHDSFPVDLATGKADLTSKP